MHVSDTAFYAMLSFLIGVGLFAYAGNFWIAALAALLAAVVLFSLPYIGLPATFSSIGESPRMKFLFFSILLCASILGAAYASGYASVSRNSFSAPMGRILSVTAIVIADPTQGPDTQTAILELHKKPYGGRVLMRTVKYPAYAYGDVVELKGVIQKPEPRAYADYLGKDRIYGIVYYPDAKLLARSTQSPIKAALYRIKNSFEEKIGRALPVHEAAFMNGLLLGERAEFSAKFKENMKLSGTTHLVALSGYNISIIAWSIANFLLIIGLGKKPSFWISVAVIIAFVVMTGAQASVVRAAIMGSILLLAGYIGKIHSIRNAIMVAAFAMVLVNPQVLRYDAGFQLSFLALLGIVYLMPAIQERFHIPNAPTLLSWREHGLTTLSAQLMVIPVVFGNFGSFSPISFF